jgi:hypothetical protein
MDYINEMTDNLPENDSQEETEQTSNTDESIEASTEEVEKVEETTQVEPEVQVDETETKIAELTEKLAKAEGRMSEKDRYINELRNQNNKADKKEETESKTEAEDGFWDDPEKNFGDVKQTVEALQFELAETRYASQNPDYYDFVNLDAVQKAAAEDKDFANDFDTASNKFDVAYTYLKNKSEEIAKSETLSREELKAQLTEEIKAELNVKPKKKAPQSVSGVGHAGTTGNEAPSDGFASVFGESY